jgi:hypothetical protein
MTKKLLSLMAISIVLLHAVSLAQPILTASGINFVIGETFKMNYSNYVSPGGAGANQTWNLAALSGTTPGLTTMVAPSSTTNGASFPNANVAGSTPSSGSSYFKTSTTALQNYGVSGTTLLAYSNPEDMLHFPCAYNNTFTDTWATQFQSSGYTFYRTGTTTVTADGYGTLITPTGTYSNVMRVHFVQVYQDSFYSGFSQLFYYNNDEYIWYKDGVHVNIASIYNLTSSISSAYTGGTFITSTVGIDNSSPLISSTDLFPNPASDKINVAFTLTENKNVAIQLFNAVGQVLDINKTADGIQGMNTLPIDVADLPVGIYFVHIMVDGNVVATKRFMVGR